MTVTFHRAFDVCSDPERTLRQLSDLGVDYVLTSGQAPSAMQGKAQLRLLRALAEELGGSDESNTRHRRPGPITLIAAAGVSKGNATCLVRDTAVLELHAGSALQEDILGPMAAARVACGGKTDGAVSMGKASRDREHLVRRTIKGRVADMRAELDSACN